MEIDKKIAEWAGIPVPTNMSNDYLLRPANTVAMMEAMGNDMVDLLIQQIAYNPDDEVSDGVRIAFMKPPVKKGKEKWEYGPSASDLPTAVYEAVKKYMGGKDEKGV